MRKAKEELKCNNKGITLIALVITIIILLILAGVTISLTVGDNGILNHATDAVEENAKATAREKLEIALADAKIKKMTQGLTDDELDKIIENAGGELLEKDDPDSNNQHVIEDGYIFEIDRSVPKIIDYVGPANGVIITAHVTQNGNWQNPVATVTGKITKYGGGSVTSSTATAKVISTGSTTTIAEFPTTGGDFSITDISEDTDITITATDSEGHDPVTKTIQVRIVRDNVPPTLSSAKAEANRMKIKISVNAQDNEGGSGLSEIKYTVSPETVTPQTGILSSGEIKELITTVEGEYTITFTAKDNAGNTTEPGITITATTIDMISLEEARTITSETLPDYIGTKVDYTPTGGGTWRVFYVEDSDNLFGDGEGTLYLKRDYDTTFDLSNYVSGGITAKGLDMMKKLNPAWREYGSNKTRTVTDTFLNNEKAVAGLCDTNNWTSYATGDSRVTTNYAIGAAPIEMWTKAQNIYRNKYDTSDSLIGCGINSSNGYGYKINNGSLVDYANGTIIVSNTSIEKSKVIAVDNDQWLASPSSYKDRDSVCGVGTGGVRSCGYWGGYGFATVVSIGP